MRNRIWILGAPDPEMELIENLLRGCGEKVIYATDESGRRVHPGNAYRCPVPEVPEGAWVYAVECIDKLPPGWLRIDHHRPGDPGFGRPPEEFLPASSIGQVLSILRGHFPPSFDGGEWITSDGGEPRDVGGFLLGMPYAERVPQTFVFAAAADHCLAAAYRGKCPGVDPTALMVWRAETRAAFQDRSVEDILADVERARQALREAPRIDLGAGMEVRDMRTAYTVTTVLVEPFTAGATVDSAGVGDSTSIEFGPRAEGAWDEGGHHVFVKRGVAELPEAAAREGVAYLATVTDRDGRTKVVLGGHTTPETVRAFMDQWAPARGLMDIYGDPARGFAGGYLSPAEEATA